MNRYLKTGSCLVEKKSSVADVLFTINPLYAEFRIN